MWKKGPAKSNTQEPFGAVTTIYDFRYFGNDNILRTVYIMIMSLNLTEHVISGVTGKHECLVIFYFNNAFFS